MSAATSRRHVTAQPFTLPIIFQDLRKSEALFQIFESLENLNFVVDGVFSKIGSRVSEQKLRLHNVGNRLNLAQAKVNHISGSKKATTVLSPAKYPANSQISYYEPMFASLERQHLKRNTYKYLADSQFSLISYTPNNEDILLSETTLVGTDTSKEGLGRLPEHLPSVSSLLLFNTQENPYKKYISLDNLAGKDLQKRQDITKKRTLAEAPKTFTEGDTLPAVGAIEYGYKPVLGEVPEFNPPSALPLPNVAELSWSGTGPSVKPIAPSFLSSDLPSVEAPPASTVASVPSESLPSVHAAPGPSSSAPPPAPPPGPAPPPPPPPSSAPPPPPGPAPPPPAPPSSAPPPVPPPSAPSSSGDRSDLLAQIREGKKLKSASSRKLGDKVTKKGKSSSKSSSKSQQGTGDLFGDLIVALNRRRVGIADKQEKSAPKDEEDIIAPPETDDGAWDP